MNARVVVPLHPRQTPAVDERLLDKARTRLAATRRSGVDGQNYPCGERFDLYDFESALLRDEGTPRNRRDHGPQEVAPWGWATEQMGRWMAQRGG